MGGVTRAQVKIDATRVLHHVDWRRSDTRIVINREPVSHCHWCGVVLYVPKKACLAHRDVEELLQRWWNGSTAEEF